MLLRESIQLLQEMARKHHLLVIIVGGAIVRLIDNDTAIKHIDEERQTILLGHAKNPSVVRIEDGKTTVDIDCIAFASATDPFKTNFKKDFTHFLQDLQNLSKTYPDFPRVSIEPVLYHPDFPKPQTFIQFVSSIESYYADNFFFRLGGVKQDVSKKSLEPWTLTFTDSKETITTFMPTALQKRYAIRGFSTKQKDKGKIFDANAPFAQFVANFRIKTKGTYDGYLTEWDEFEKKIATSKQPSMVLKRHMWNIYWQTIGTYLAHGTGILGKFLLPLGNTFFAGK